ncbi:hypothetical protein DIRTYBETTY_136 [Bacillus phage DirtyBetty]|uniref:Uncharacterized protein n=2 Tax=Wphvirus megatron TaxID=1987728 RepID=A0A1B1PB36_9CAUD|nr:hypothetical protein QLX47_gp134 [Bacillus phage Eyuki]YP_009285078.1 hypothetical protein BIZ88_gp136 [Bacillus phage DirtyBetty]ALA46791.1 hypothetical protein EYUKI_134 [Bacillus phage Eyuki]ANT41370.1 hypothetical protein DIRTYBETTY_136 [Bacillus phage DirtyBetty]
MTKNQKALTKAQLTEEVAAIKEQLSKGSATPEELQIYLDYITTGDVKFKEEADFIPVFANSSATIADATILARFAFSQILGEFEQQLTRTMRTVHVLEEVAVKLGATQEMFDEVAEAHDKKVEELTKAQAEEIIKQQSETAGA